VSATTAKNTSTNKGANGIKNEITTEMYDNSVALKVILSIVSQLHIAYLLTTKIKRIYQSK
jgi:hypothetical protein